MFYSLAPNIRTALRVYSCILLALLAYCLCALNARAQVNDVSTNFNLIGNPYAARYPAPIPVSIRAFATYKSAEFNANQERLYISGGSTNSPTNRGDIWSLNPIDDSFRLEISQGDLEQTGIFRILGNQLYLTNEDDIDFQNFYRLDASGWVRYGSNKAGSGHSYEAYLYDRLIYTLRRGDMRNPNFISSVDNGVTWNINPPVPIGSDEADAGQDTRFFELNNIAYALGSNCPHMLRRFDPRREASLVDIPLCVKDSNGNLTSPFGPGLNLNSAPQVFKRKLVFLGGYGQGLGVISQIEPTLVSQTNIGPANILQYFVQEGVLYTLSPTPSATGYYSVYASTDLSTFSELFRFKPPSSVARPYQFALAGGNFYFTTTGIFPNSSGENGKIYKIAKQFFNLPQATLPPPEPSHLVTTVSGNSIVLTWNNNAAATYSLELQRKQQNDGNFLPIATLPAGSTTFTDLNTLSGTEYVYRVRVLSGNPSIDDSGFSNIALTSRPSLGAGPSNFIAQVVGTNKVSLKWAAVLSGDFSFEIERRFPNDGFWTPVSNTPFGATTYDDSSIVANTQYQYRVRGLSNTGRTSFSYSTNVSTLVFGGAPSNLAGNALSHQAIRFDWIDNNTAESLFVIENLSALGWANYDSVAANTTSYVASLFIPNPATFRVRAKMPDGSYTDASNQITVTIPPAQTTVPSAPSTLAASSVTSSAIHFTWKDNSSNESWFSVERKLSSQSDLYYSAISFGTNRYGGAIMNLIPNTTSASDTNATAGATYNYRVRAENEAGKSAASNVITITAPNAPPPSPSPSGSSSSSPSTTPSPTPTVAQLPPSSSPPRAPSNLAIMGN